MARALLARGLVHSHVSMGQLLRDIVATTRRDRVQRAEVNAELRALLPDGARDPLGEVERCMGAGLLIPNVWTQHLISRQLRESLTLQQGRWLLDGYPRRVVVARHLLTTLQALDLPVLKVVHLNIDAAEQARRSLARRRDDDSPEAIARRWAIYEQEVLPTIAFLRGALPPGTVCDIDASTPGMTVADGERELTARVLSALL